MVLVLVSLGFDYRYILWEVGIWEFSLLFSNAICLYLRNLQMQSLCFVGSIGAFFTKPSQKTYIDYLSDAIEDIALMIEQKPKQPSLATSQEFEQSFAPLKKVLTPIYGLPPGGIPEE